MVVFCLLLFVVWVVMMGWFLSKPKSSSSAHIPKPCLKKQTLDREVRLSVVSYKQDFREDLDRRSAGMTPAQLRGIREYKRNRGLVAIVPSNRALPTHVEPSTLTKETSTQTDDKDVTIRSVTTKESWTKEYAQPRQVPALRRGYSDHYWMFTSLLLSGVIIALLTLYVIR